MRAGKTSVWLMISPGLALVLLPVATLPILSLHRGRFLALPWSGWSMQWFASAINDGSLHDAIWRSVAVASLTALLATVFGFMTAYALTREGVSRPTSWLVYMALPSFTPALILGYSLLSFSSELGFARTTMAVVCGHVVVFSPAVIALISQRCAALNREVEDAAREFGLSEIGVARYVVAPQLLPSIVGAGLIVFVLSWDEYMIAWFVSGFEKTYPVKVREILDSTASPEILAAGVVLGACSLAICAFGWRLIGGRVESGVDG